MNLPLLIGLLLIAVVRTAHAQDARSVGQLSEPIFDRLLQSDEPQPLLSELKFEHLPQPFEPIPELNSLILLPSSDTVTWLDEQFSLEVAPLNARIAFRQELLEELLSDPNSNDNRIRQVQSILSKLRAERDRLAIEHLLLVRQLSDGGKIPNPPINNNLELVSPAPKASLPVAQE